MRIPRRLTVSGIALATLLAGVFATAEVQAQQEEPTPSEPAIQTVQPTPSDPAAQRAWSRVEAARARAAEAERKYQETQQALRDAPKSSEAKTANRAAKKERDRAQKEVSAAESDWRRRLAQTRGQGSRGESVPAMGVPPSATPTPIPLGGDVLLPTPIRDTVPAAPAAAPFAGLYRGDWSNKTFNSGGPASAGVTVDTAGRTFEVVLTLGGNVFGVGAPGPQTLRGSYDAGGRSINLRSDLFGNLSVTISTAGAIQGTATGLPNANIARVEFTGSATTQTITVNYTVHFAGGETAQGVMTLNRVSTPSP